MSAASSTLRVSPLRGHRLATILAVDLYGTALVIEEFGNVIARGGAGVVISPMSGHRLPPLTSEQNAALATTPTDELLALPMLQLDQSSSANRLILVIHSRYREVKQSY